MDARLSGLVDGIVAREWAFFQETENRGGRASCQDSPRTFALMRRAQFAAWSPEALESYSRDLDQARAEGRNPLAEKYAYMMERTHPAEFEALKELLPPLSQAKRALVDRLAARHLAWEEACDRLYPHVRSKGRPLRSSQDGPRGTSFETYLRGELSTYSERTLRALLARAEEAERAGLNLAELSLDETARGYGHASIRELERLAASREA